MSEHDQSNAAPISMSAPSLSGGDIEAVLDVLRSGVLALGPRAHAFEASCADIAGTSFGVAVSSGTAGLHLIAVALGLGPGDEVLVPSFTFVASVNAILYAGATPVFCDIEPDTFNIDPAEIRKKRTDRTKAVVVVDVFGHPADWDAISDAAEGLLLIDDSCEAIGAKYKGKAVGGFGMAGCFAFYPNKQITTGEGGMIVTDDEELAERCRSLRNQGRGRMGAWLEHEQLGFNYRMDELSAALGVSQIARLGDILTGRSEVARSYGRALQGFPGVQLPAIRSGVEMSWFVYVVMLDRKIDRDAVVHSLEAAGVPTRVYFPPLHRQGYLMAFATDELPVTDDVASRTLALPFHTSLAEMEVAEVVEALKRAIA